MDSYQYGDDSESLKLNMLSNETEPQQRKSSASYTWRYIAIIAILGATAVLSYTASGNSLLRSSETRISLVKKGRGDIKYSDLTKDETRALFEEFKTTFNKKYDTEEEESERFQNFVVFLSKAEVRNNNENVKGGSAIHGITKFADRSETELKSLLGYKKPSRPSTQLSAVTVTIADYDMTDAPTVTDWSTSLATAVKDQGYCGSCWAFSATSQIESDAIRAGYLTTSDTLSEQQIISCDTTDYGCDGGYTEYAYSYVYNAGGLVSDTSYPYTSYYDQTGKCSSSLSSMTKLVSVSTYYSLDSEDTMAAHVLTTGPLSVCLDASSWSTYVSGIVSTCGTDVDHCVQAVGLNTDESYWLVRNSWGTEWGMDGYILLEYGTNMCEIANDPTYVEVTNLQ